MINKEEIIIRLKREQCPVFARLNDEARIVQESSRKYRELLKGKENELQNE